MLANEVRPGANRYVSGENILKDLPSYLTDFNNIAVVTGVASFEAFEAFYPNPFDYPVYRYDGSSSYENGADLAKEIGTADLIIGIGGGRLMDTAKMVAENLNAEALLIPTLISNCAPFTPVAAVYHPDRTFRSIGYFKKAPYLTFVDTRFLIDTPIDYYVAGIGDTLAKWVEIDGLVKNLPAEKRTAHIRLGIQSAKTINDILLTDAVQAVSDLKTKTISPAFTRITDTIIALAGEVGGFAVAYGRSAGAHAIHDGLSYLPETHEMLHGKKVAYGILVQLAYMKDFSAIDELVPFYQALDLPLKLSQLNVIDTSVAHLTPVVKHAASADETFCLVDAAISPEAILTAIDYVEQR